VNFSLITNLFGTVFVQPMYNLLMLIFGLTHSFPVAIVVITLLVRTAMIPLFMKQLTSQRAMQVIAPDVQEIQRKYRSEPQVLQKELNALYKENGVNPYAGCLPTLVQLPFLWALYGAFRTILGATKPSELNSQLYPFVKSIFGPQGLTSIVHAYIFNINLASPDASHVLPVIAALLTFAQLRMAIVKNKQPKKPGAATDPNAASMKMMQYMMPLVTLFSASYFAAGLALYWTVTTAYSVGQQYLVNGRSWGPLLEGLPFFKSATPEVALAGVPVSATGSARNRRIVVESTPTVAKDRPKAKITPLRIEAPLDEEQEQEQDVVNGDRLPAALPKPRPITSKTPTRPNAPRNRDAVRLVPASPNTGATNGTNSGPVHLMNTQTNTAAVARAPKVATVARAKSVNNANRANQARKKK